MAEQSTPEYEYVAQFYAGQSPDDSGGEHYHYVEHGLSTCLTCGAVVSDTDRHTAWHIDLRKTIRTSGILGGIS